MGDKRKRKQIDERISSQMREFSFDISCQHTAAVVFYSLLVLKLHIFVHRHQMAHALTSAFCLHDVHRKVFFLYLPTTVPVCACMTAARLIDPSIEKQGKAKRKEKKKWRDCCVVCVLQFSFRSIIRLVKLCWKQSGPIEMFSWYWFCRIWKKKNRLLFYVTQRQASR